MNKLQSKMLNWSYGKTTLAISRFASRCTGAVKERWQQWIPWEWGVRKGLDNSLHFVCHASSYEKPKHLSHLYPVPTPEALEYIFRKISRKYKVIDTEEYVDRIRRDKLKEKQLLATVTCDDGLREFKTFLWPIMKKYSIPCTLFLVRNFVEQKEYYYRFKTSLILDTLDKPEALQRAQDCLVKVGRSVDPKKGIKKTIAQIHHPDEHWLLDSLIDNLGIQIKSYFEENSPFLNRHEVIELRDDGVRLGSHGLHHYRYDLLSPDKVIRDILDGVAYIQELSGQRTVEHAFPFNGRKVSREILLNILSSQYVLTHFFDTGGIRRDVPFVTNRIILDAEKPRRALRQAAYQYINSK